MNPMNYDIIRGAKYESSGAASTARSMTPEVSPMLNNDNPTNNSIPYGYCHCGCGGKTRVAHKSLTAKGWVKGKPKRFIHGHNARVESYLPIPPRIPVDPSEWDDEVGCYRIPLASSKYPGLYAMVDEGDFELVSQYRWSVHVGTSAKYAATSSHGKVLLMHRLILDPAPSLYVDHANGCGLDNRRSNIRVATPAENQRNRSGLQKNNSSGYTGVRLSESRGKWEATIHSEGRRYWVGYFDDPKTAAMARDAAALVVHGEFASLNIPYQENIFTAEIVNGRVLVKRPD